MRLLILLLLNLPSYLYAQWNASIITGYGFYNMSDLKELQHEFNNNLPVDASITESFPSFPYFELQVSHANNHHLRYGSYISYCSTGGRIYYEDYSGKINMEQLLKAYSFSGMIGFSKGIYSNKLNLLIDLQIGIIMSDLKLKFDERINNQSDTESYSFNADNLYFQPNFSLDKRVGHLGIRATAGYHLSVIEGKLNFNENKEVYLTNSNDDPILADWSGLRFGIGLGFWF